MGSWGYIFFERGFKKGGGGGMRVRKKKKKGKKGKVAEQTPKEGR